MVLSRLLCLWSRSPSVRLPHGSITQSGGCGHRVLGGGGASAGGPARAGLPYHVLRHPPLLDLVLGSLYSRCWSSPSRALSGWPSSARGGSTRAGSSGAGLHLVLDLAADLQHLRSFTRILLVRSGGCGRGLQNSALGGVEGGQAPAMKSTGGPAPECSRRGRELGRGGEAPPRAGRVRGPLGEAFVSISCSAGTTSSMSSMRALMKAMLRHLEDAEALHPAPQDAATSGNLNIFRMWVRVPMRYEVALHRVVDRGVSGR